MHPRRRLLALLATAIATPVFRALAQPQAPRIGLLWIRDAANLAAFRDGLSALGYLDGRNIRIDERFLVDSYEALPDAASRLVRENPAIIVLYGSTAFQAVRKLTSTIPIVVVSAGNLVAQSAGAVASLARPGGNVTGTMFAPEGLAVKRLELLLAVDPRMRRVAIVLFPGSPGEMSSLKNMQDAARTLNIGVRAFEVRKVEDIMPVVSKISRPDVDGISFVGSSLFYANRRLVVGAAQKSGLPASYSAVEFVEAGGLLSYGPNVPNGFRYIARYVDKILKGAKPGDLPIEQPSSFELAINLKTAKSQGITIPKELLVRADRIIQ